MRLLLISNSTNAGEEYLEYPREEIGRFLGKDKIDALFIPYAAVTFSYDEYEKKVSGRFAETGHSIRSIHHEQEPLQAIEQTEAIVVGGGNTWHLLKTLQDNKLLEPLKEAVLDGKPYIGWSAGSNMACPTIRTTNDMPITEPDNFKALSLIPFQINPHYLDANPEGHAGESRETRIREFIEINKDIYVVGLREGTMLRIENQNIKLIGPKTIRLFRKGMNPVELSGNDNLDFLLIPPSE
ncbi:MAG: dipeptidase PepE [Chlorobi bacterium]|nr:dipeptidase PepE [Chlorobiota bacterium]